MKDPQKIWAVYDTAKKLSCRPSDVIGIKNEVTAYFFNRGVLYFGSTIEQDIEEKTRKMKSQDQARAKARMIFGQWMISGDEIPKGLFKTPSL